MNQYGEENLPKFKRLNVGADNTVHTMLNPIGQMRRLAAQMRLPHRLLSAFICVVLLDSMWEDFYSSADDSSNESNVDADQPMVLKHN